MSVSVFLRVSCVSVCTRPQACISATTLPIFTNFVLVIYGGCSEPRPILATLRYVIYFRFYGWRHLRIIARSRRRDSTGAARVWRSGEYSNWPSAGQHRVGRGVWYRRLPCCDSRVVRTKLLYAHAARRRAVSRRAAVTRRSTARRYEAEWRPREKHSTEWRREFPGTWAWRDECDRSSSDRRKRRIRQRKASASGRTTPTLPATTPSCHTERKCADTTGTVPILWAGHFQC